MRKTLLAFTISAALVVGTQAASQTLNETNRADGEDGGGVLRKSADGI